MFYDLNLCVDGAREQAKREMVAMAMQLGYVAIAQSHVVAGRMTDADRCKLQPLAVDSLLAACPGLGDSAKYHRRLLRVPSSAPFRQYSRITVAVEDQMQAAALNLANPVLQGYDIVAVQPKNHKMFLQACSQMEVDLISLDFTQKLPFRIKSPNVKAAVQRGIIFEICYGPALSDLRVRRELFANVQILVAVTRGQNITLSSGAKTAMELRGPNDVANMSTLFGLSMEHARRAISETCKSVLLHGFTRRKTHKAAVMVEHTEQPEHSLFEVPAVWEPLSTPGECVLSEADDDSHKTIDPASPVTSNSHKRARI